MVSYETHDPLAAGSRQALAGISQASRKPVDPEATVGIEHDLDDGGIFEPPGDRRSQASTFSARSREASGTGTRNITFVTAMFAARTPQSRSSSNRGGHNPAKAEPQ
jgi:hypothetical protein